MIKKVIKNIERGMGKISQQKILEKFKKLLREKKYI